MDEGIIKGNNKIYLKKDGIVYVDVLKDQVSEKEILDLLNTVKETTKKLPEEPKLLIINLVRSDVFRSYRFRKKIGERFKEISFSKAAIYEDNIFSRTVATFIIAASGLEYIKVFSSKKKALKWLKGG